MPDDPNPTPSNGAASPAETPEPRLSLREVAEQTWNDIEQESAPAREDGGEEPTGQEGQPRDNLGRFASKDAKPGEQSQDPATTIDPKAPNEATPADPAADEARSNQPPQHWSEQDRATFAKLDPEGQAFLLRRHSEMERDYQSKAQASAAAVQFTNALAPVFQDPVMSGSLQQAGLSAYDAIGQWAGFHRRAIDPNPQVRMALWQELGQRMGLDPAATGQMSRLGPGQLSEADLKDPAIRYFADNIGKTLSGLEALRGEVTSMQQATEQRAAAEAVKVQRWNIDSFADEKDAQGNLKHPHFDAVLPHMIELYRANPERDLKTAYDMACWAVPEIRSQLIAAERNSVQQQKSNERARQAARSNVRGITSPVAKPAGDGKPKGLRATLEAAADEVGI